MNLITPKDCGLLLASMPSSGSDWLASCIKEAVPSLNYSREHFSPLCNLRDSELLSEHFGDYLYDSTHNLCSKLTDQHLSCVLNQVWVGRGHTFCKENYLAFKLDAFAKRFDTIVFARRTEDTFPPNRQRVTAWYEHAYHAALKAGLVPLYVANQCRNPMDKAVVGHQVFLRQLVSSAKSLGLRLVWWHDMISPDTIEDALRPENEAEDRLVSVMKRTAKLRVEPDPEYTKLYLASLSLLELF